jgi:hypothetical protein
VLRDDWDQLLSGVGLIDKVTSSGPQPVFRADGYLIRVTPATKCVFHGELKTLSDVGANTWLRYQARRGSDGILNAASASFFVGRLKATAGKPDTETMEMHLEAPDLDAHKDGSVNLGMLPRPHRIPADSALQRRVMRVGAELVPAYQKDLPDGSRFKIDFRFYALDERNLCLNGCAFHGGLILIAKQSVDRLPDDSQLAAVLAECVADELQKQASRQPHETPEQIGAAVAGDAGILALSPLFMVPFEVGWSVERVELERLQQRQRLALAMLDDAGLDPWQAPEAWRILASRQLPQGPGSLKYPARGEYQLSVLNLQYRPKQVGVAEGRHAGENN